jgi:hypothetical protein
MMVMRMSVIVSMSMPMSMMGVRSDRHLGINCQGLFRQQCFNVSISPIGHHLQKVRMSIDTCHLHAAHIPMLPL